jgi:hypothetical protein
LSAGPSHDGGGTVAGVEVGWTGKALSTKPPVDLITGMMSVGPSDRIKVEFAQNQ